MTDESNTTKLLITPEHIKGAGMCIEPGTRKFFARYGLDFRKFIRDKHIDAEELLATKDALAFAVVEFAKNELLKNG